MGNARVPPYGYSAMAKRAEADNQLQPLRELRRLLVKGGPRSWDEGELVEFPRLYRHACSVVARLEASGESPRLASEARRLVAQAHGILYLERADRAPLLERLYRLLVHESPRAIRAEWRLLAGTFAFVYGLALLAWFAVSRDLDLAPSPARPGHGREPDPAAPEDRSRGGLPRELHLRVG